MVEQRVNYEEVVMGRRSIIGCLPDPVPKSLIKEVLEMTIRAPSSLNIQAWNFYVVSGEPLDRIREGNTERNLAGVPDSREFRGHGAYEGAHRERQIGIAVQLFESIGFPDDSFPANAVVSERKSVEDAAVFFGFED